MEIFENPGLKKYRLMATLRGKGNRIIVGPEREAMRVVARGQVRGASERLQRHRGYDRGMTWSVIGE